MLSKHQWGILDIFGIVFLFSTVMIVSAATNTQSVPKGGSSDVRIPENAADFQKAGNNFISLFPESLKQTWNQALGFWARIGDRLNDLWANGINSRVSSIVDRFNSIIGREKAIRGPIIRNEFEKEKTEMKDSINNDLPPVTKSIWDSIRGLFAR